MTILQRIKKLWELTDGDFNGLMTQDTAKQSEPFVTFPCPECELALSIEEFIYPGDAKVITCGNCNTSVTIFSPQLAIYKTKELPKTIQDKVWSVLGS